MKLTAKSETWKEFIGIADGIAALEARIHVDEDKVWYRMVDTGNVAMAIAELPIDAFSEHTFEPCSFCIDLVKFRTAFQFGGKEISLEMKSPEDTVLIVESGGYVHSQTLLHDSTVKKDPNFPALELPGIVEISGKAYADAIKVGSLISDKIWLKIVNGVFMVSAMGDSPSDKIEKPFEDVISVSGEASSLFSKDYLVGMNRQLTGDIKINIGIDFPFIIEFDFAGGHGKGKYLLAPRVESE
jgi:proliferating cell nuclear antigen